MRTIGASTVVLVLVVLMMAGFVHAMQHEATVDKGRMLFNDVKLGMNGKSCNDCHKEGSGLEKAGARTDLEAMVNTCITKALNGKALKTSSVEMQSIMLYIKGLGSEKKTSGKKVPVGR